MIVVRDVFRAKYGMGGQLEDLFKEVFPIFEQTFKEVGGGKPRLLEDLSGDFFTLVTEYTLPSLSVWEAVREKMFTDSRFEGWFERMLPLVESGNRQFWNVVID
ncbi:MAG: hypothetical protein O3B84_04405 [Chloroflexi bacterium]|nr:hypothetical protein [Chloroflexota bacterium]